MDVVCTFNLILTLLPPKHYVIPAFVVLVTIIKRSGNTEFWTIVWPVLSKWHSQNLRTHSVKWQPRWLPLHLKGLVNGSLKVKCRKSPKHKRWHLQLVQSSGNTGRSEGGREQIMPQQQRICLLTGNPQTSHLIFNVFTFTWPEETFHCTARECGFFCRGLLVCPESSFASILGTFSCWKQIWQRRSILTIQESNFLLSPQAVSKETYAHRWTLSGSTTNNLQVIICTLQINTR